MEDPLQLGHLDATIIGEAVATRNEKKNESKETAKLRAETNSRKEERLSRGKAVDPGPSAPPPPPPPVVDKSKLLDKLGNYRERFPDLKTRNKVSARSSVEEIEDEIHYIQLQLGQKEQNMGVSVFLAAMAAMEEGSRHFNTGLNLNGLHGVARDNQAEFTPIIDELVIKYGASMYVSPEMRLAMAVGTLVYTVHSANSGNPEVARALAKMSAPAPVKGEGM